MASLVCPGKYSFQAEFPTSIINVPQCDLQNNIMLIPGVYERPLIDWAVQFLSKGGGNFVDIGAHVGSWTLIMAKHAKNVTAFEPQKMRYYQLCGNIAINGLDNVTAINYGLASPDRSGSSLMLTKFGKDTGSSTLRPDVVENTRHEVQGLEMVQIKCLDEFNLNGVSLIKIDVEGYELEVLKGALQTLERCRPSIILELWSDDQYERMRKETIEWLEEHHYKVVRVNGWPDEYLATPVSECN